MRLKAVKQELIQWLSQLEDSATIEYLKIVKDAQASESDWWDHISDDQKAGIERGLEDIKKERTIAGEDVRSKYGI